MISRTVQTEIHATKPQDNHPKSTVLCYAVPCCHFSLTQAKGTELLALTDNLHACEAELGQLRRQASSMQVQLDAAQAKVTQQAAALTAAQEAHSTLQVRWRAGMWACSWRKSSSNHHDTQPCLQPHVAEVPCYHVYFLLC